METEIALKPKKSDYVQTAVRLPPELHKALHEAADREERTFNGQLVALLRAAVMPVNHTPSPVAGQHAQAQ